MKRVDYDVVAPMFDRRYQTYRQPDTEAVVRRFLAACETATVAEVGCGTGHWLNCVDDLAGHVLGADISGGMLTQAKRNGSKASLVRAAAEALPWSDASISRLFCVNALHHFSSPKRFFEECRRVLRPSGALLSIALDPHIGRDRWWIYDYFPAAVALDHERYLATNEIRKLLTLAGFVDTVTTVAQRIPGSMPYAEALARGLLDRRSTSQLMVISDEDYATGLARLELEQPVLSADLTLYATTASLP